MNMIIIPQAQIDDMTEVMDYILAHPSFTVLDIKNHFNLTNDEYNMVYDFCMPSVRKGNKVAYWKNKYASVMNFLKEQIRYVFETKDKKAFFRNVLDYYSANCDDKTLKVETDDEEAANDI